MRINKYRSHYCGSITEKEINQDVKIAGFIENIRDHGGVVFLDIRDESGYLQIVSNDDSIFDGLTKESTVCVCGKIRSRKKEDYNEKINTGKLELLVDSIQILSKAKSILPFEIITSHEVNEAVRSKYRYLDLRNPKVHDNIVFRSKVIDYLRTTMKDLGFLDIQTPILTVSSPEGARDFIVPSRKYHGKFYALPQAPQIFKQLLMVGGFERYFQIAPCFRDEDARIDRAAGEFYQLDLEMAFAHEEDVYEVGEKIFYDTFTKFTDKKVNKPPFRRISYHEAMEKYGTDKPDLRNPLEIIDLTDILKNTSFKPFQKKTIKGISVPNLSSKSNSWFNDLVAFAKKIGMPGIGYIIVEEDMSWKGPIDKFLTEEERMAMIKKAGLKKGSVLFFIADFKRAKTLAGQIRDELGKRLDLLDKNKFEFCIINDFPMYEYNEETKKYDFTHNPFSMPKGGMKALSEEKLDGVLACQFDFVCNGIEVASGAVRNHDIEIMKKAFELAGYDNQELEKKFNSLYTAFHYGVPPHAGMAPGIDRMLMLMRDLPSIRETSAFSLSSSGQDVMMGCPSEVSEQQLREVHIKVR